MAECLGRPDRRKSQPVGQGDKVRREAVTSARGALPYVGVGCGLSWESAKQDRGRGGFEFATRSLLCSVMPWPWTTHARRCRVDRPAIGSTSRFYDEEN